MLNVYHLSGRAFTISKVDSSNDGYHVSNIFCSPVGDMRTNKNKIMGLLTHYYSASNTVQALIDLGDLIKLGLTPSKVA